MSRDIFQHYLRPFLLALVVGALAGLGAVAFKALIAFGQQTLWPAGTDFVQQLKQADWWWLLLIPAGMALLAGPIITFWAPEVRGPGVPEVMEALALRGGSIRHRVTAIKTLVTASLISAGASVGREGPIVQIGSSIGSSITQMLKLGSDARRLAVACGAAAGIGATFQAPMTGTLFAVEILLYDLEVTSLSNIVIAAVTGTTTARLFSGQQKVFKAPEFALQHPAELLLYFALGIAAGLLSLLLMKIIFSLPKAYKKTALPEWLTPALGGVMVGLIALFNPWAPGVGYESINLALAGKLSLTFVAALLAMKLLATGLCIGSGMSGGIFAPSLVLGAMLGSLIGFGGQHLWPEAGLIPSHYALIGMGAMVSGTTLAPITAILSIFELTYTYEVITPLMVSVIASVMVVRLLHGYSIYETKLLQKGIDIVKGREVNTLRSMKVRDHMSRDLQILRRDTYCPEIIHRMEQSSFPHFVVLDAEDRLIGVLSLHDFRRILAHPDLCNPDNTAGALMTEKILTVSADDSLEKAFHLFARHNFSFLPVMSAKTPGKVVGQLKKTDLLAAYDQRIFKDHVLAPAGWVCPLCQKKEAAEVRGKDEESAG